VERDIPCRVSADLRALDRKQTADRLDALDFSYLAEDFQHVVGRELAQLFERLYSPTRRSTPSKARSVTRRWTRSRR
jgi:hypothetical protein